MKATILDAKRGPLLCKLAKGLGVVVALALAKGALADYVTLMQGDKDGTSAEGASSYTSSFLTNSPLAGEGYGWSDGGDPDPNKDYLVSSGTLFTPYGTGSATYAFPGGSLTLDGGYLGNRSCTDSGASTVYVGNLIFKRGSVGSSNWARNNVWDGVFTFDGSGHGHDYAKIKFAINLKTATINAKLIASSAENVQLYGQTMNAVQSSSDYYWVKNPYAYKFSFSGDCTQYLATNHLYWSSAAYVNTADFAGSFFLGNVGYLTIGSGISAAQIGGAVKSRDGWIEVPQNKTMDVCGGLDFAFAERSTHVYNGTDVYTREPSTQPYANVNGIARQPQISLNAVTVASGATLSTPRASLSGTLVSIADGATLTIGDAALDGVILAINGSGRLELTNSLTASTPVTLRLGGAGTKKALVTLPVDKGELKVEDFTFDFVPQFRHTLTVETEGGVQTLWATDINPDVKDATTGYVVLKTADGSSSSTFTIGSYNQAGNWSEADREPHPGTNYYTNGKLIRDKSAASKTFQGDSLTQSGGFRLGRTTFEIKDWRVLSNGKTVMTDRTQITTSGSKGTFTFEGRLTVFATNASPFTLYGGLSNYSGENVTSRQTYVMKTKIVGAPDSAISADGANTQAPGFIGAQAACNFVGDMTEFYGTLYIGTNETVRLGDTGIPNGTVVLRTAYSTLTTLATNKADVAVGTLRTTWPTTVEVPATNTLSAGFLDVTGALAKNGAGMLRAGGAATAGEDAAISVNAGGIRAESKDAFNGIQLSFAAGTSLTLPLATSDVDFAKYGLYDSAAVTAAGTLNVVLDATGVEETPGFSRGVLTVPTSAAGGLLEKLSVSSPWKGYRVLLSAAAEGDMTIFTAKMQKLGFNISIR